MIMCSLNIPWVDNIFTHCYKKNNLLKIWYKISKKCIEVKDAKVTMDWNSHIIYIWKLIKYSL